jgi:putative ABC transport system permease protein
MLAETTRDVRYAWRNLRSDPTFTATVLLSLALGIGATTAIYSVVDGVVLNPFPYKDVDTLMSVRVYDPGRFSRTYYSPEDFLEIAERNTIFEGVVASTISDVLWTGEGEPQRLRGNHVTTNTFGIMGVPPLLGRAIEPSDGEASATPVVVLGYKFWQRQFAGNPNVLGRQMRLDNQVRTIIGVMPRRFMWRGADVYVPVVMRRAESVEGIRSFHFLGRLKPGMSVAQAETDLKPIIAELKRRDPNGYPDNWRVTVISFRETFPSALRSTLWILFGAVGLLLLIACANVSNLLLSKAATRLREIAVRASLGAGRRRLVRQLLTESLLLALAGAALGVLLSWAGLKAIIAIVPPDTIPDESEIVLNARVLWFTVGVSILSAFIFGLTPALQMSSLNLLGVLREGGRGSAGSRRQNLLRSGLVVVQVALSLVLLAGASVMVRSLLAIQSAELTMQPERLLTLRVPLPQQRYPDAAARIAFFERVLDRLEDTPGIQAVGINTYFHPLGNWTLPAEVPGTTYSVPPTVVMHQVNPGYLKALRIPLVRGRLLEKADVTARRRVALVDEAFVKRYFGRREPLGSTVRMPGLSRPPFSLSDPAFQIVGILSTVPNGLRAEQTAPELYLPYTLTGFAGQLVVRGEGAPNILSSVVRQVVYSIDAEQPVMDVYTLQSRIEREVYSSPRFNLVLFSIFAALGLLLAIIGIYAIVSSFVSQQTREIGVRIALGATFGTVVGMVIRRGLWLLGVGCVLGLIGSVFGVRVLSGMVTRVSPLEPVSLMLVMCVLIAVGVAACLWPAQRAARIDPAVTLRTE